MATKYILLAIVATGMFLFMQAGLAVDCVEDWSCTIWAPCVNNHQSRLCTDRNGCGTTNNMPPVVQECQQVPVCGNLVCESGESSSNCQIDCGKPAPSLPSASVSLGIKNPTAHTWFYNESSADLWNELAQIRIANDGAEDITLFTITLKASGSGNDATDINKIEIYADLNNDGSVGAGDIKIGAAQPAYNQDNGQTTIGLNYNIQKGDTKVFLVAYVMKPAAPAGATYEFTVTNIKAVGKTTGSLFSINGLPITSATKTIVTPPAPQPPQQLVCTGLPSLSFKPNPAKISQQVNAGISGLNNCIGWTATVVDENKVIACQTVLQNGMDGACQFNAPYTPGLYIYSVVVDENQNNVIDIGEITASKLNVILPNANSGETGEQNIAPPEKLINTPAVFTMPVQAQAQQAGQQPINAVLAVVAVIAAGSAAYYYSKARKQARKKRRSW